MSRRSPGAAFAPLPILLCLATVATAAGAADPVPDGGPVPSDPVFTALRIDGTTTSGRIRQLGPEDELALVPVEGPEQVIPLDRLVKLSREGGAALLRPGRCHRPLPRRRPAARGRHRRGRRDEPEGPLVHARRPRHPPGEPARAGPEAPDGGRRGRRLPLSRPLGTAPDGAALAGQRRPPGGRVPGPGREEDQVPARGRPDRAGTVGGRRPRLRPRARRLSTPRRDLPRADPGRRVEARRDGPSGRTGPGGRDHPVRGAHPAAARRVGERPRPGRRRSPTSRSARRPPSNMCRTWDRPGRIAATPP